MPHPHQTKYLTALYIYEIISCIIAGGSLSCEGADEEWDGAQLCLERHLYISSNINVLSGPSVFKFE